MPGLHVSSAPYSSRFVVGGFSPDVSFTYVAPAGTQVGDLLFIQQMWWLTSGGVGNHIDDSAITPSGLLTRVLDISAGGADMGQRVYFKIADATDAAGGRVYTITDHTDSPGGSTVRDGGAIHVYRGLDTNIATWLKADTQLSALGAYPNPVWSYNRFGPANFGWPYTTVGPQSPWSGPPARTCMVLHFGSMSDHGDTFDFDAALTTRYGPTSGGTFAGASFIWMADEVIAAGASPPPKRLTRDITDTTVGSTAMIDEAIVIGYAAAPILPALPVDAYVAEVRSDVYLLTPAFIPREHA